MSFFKNAIQESWTNKILLELIIAFAFIFGVYGAFDEYLALIFKGYKISLELVGVLFAVNYILYAAGCAIAGLVKLRSQTILYLLTFLSGLLIFIPGALVKEFWIISIFPAAFFLGLIEVKIISGVQRLISSDSRATILSIKVFLQEILAIAFTITLGVISDQSGSGVGSILLLTGAGLVISAFYPLMLKLIFSNIYKGR